jgi:hypothetical protein
MIVQFKKCAPNPLLIAAGFEKIDQIYNILALTKRLTFSNSYSIDRFPGNVVTIYQMIRFRITFILTFFSNS